MLAAALAVAIAVAVHYRAEVAAVRQHPRPVSASRPAVPGPVTLSSRTVTLPSYGTLDGSVTIAFARFSGGLEQIVVSARITGGRPHNEYTLYGFDCTGSTGYQPWAAGRTDARGSGNLTGHAWAVSPPTNTGSISARRRGSPGRASTSASPPTGGSLSAFP